MSVTDEYLRERRLVGERVAHHVLKEIRDYFKKHKKLPTLTQSWRYARVVEDELDAFSASLDRHARRRRAEEREEGGTHE